MNPDLYNNKYRIESSRLKNWDYGRNASYFVTICTRNREKFFGEILDGEMHLSEIGQEAEKYWQKIPDLFPFVILDEFIVMPNHMHGIVVIDKPDDHTAVIADGGGNSNRGGITGNHNPMTQENLSRILRWYKGRVKFESREIQPDFGWHPRFHDHIIRNQRSFERIRDYIINNPLNWQEDKFYNK